MKKFAKVIAKDMKKKAFTQNAEQAMDILENKYNAELFEAWDNENKPLEETIKDLLKEENIILSPEELNDVIDYINISFM